MKFRPLSMHPFLVPAVLDGRKTMTRMPLKLKGDALAYFHSLAEPRVSVRLAQWWPLGAVGDGLWLRERARVVSHAAIGLSRVWIEYEAGAVRNMVDWPSRLKYVAPGCCIPNGVHREGARWHGEIVEVRVERVQDITKADARAEGVEHVDGDSLLSSGGWRNYGRTEYEGEHVSYFLEARESVSSLWDSIYAPGFWERNDWVWVVRWRALEETHDNT